MKSNYQESYTQMWISWCHLNNNDKNRDDSDDLSQFLIIFCNETKLDSDSMLHKNDFGKLNCYLEIFIDKFHHQIEVAELCFKI